MKIQTVWAAYFSATDTTKTVVTQVARELSRRCGAPLAHFDFTPPQVRRRPKTFGPGDLVVFGTPVYAGRVPNLLLKYIASIQGLRAFVVPIVCYGNRNYDDALMELCRTLEAGGFHTLSAAAFSCQHAFSQTQAAGRPDASDLTIAGSFAYQTAEKLSALPTLEALGPADVRGNDPAGPYYTPRDRHGNPINILKVTPKTGDACTGCALCAEECPLGSIDPEDPKAMAGPCMKCNRCVRLCPAGAKYFDDPKYLYHKTELEAQFSFPRKEPELFL